MITAEKKNVDLQKMAGRTGTDGGLRRMPGSSTVSPSLDDAKKLESHVGQRDARHQVKVLVEELAY